MVFELDAIFCEWLCKVGVCFCFGVVVDDLCFKLRFGYVVICYGKLVWVFVLPFLLMICD